MIDSIEPDGLVDALPGRDGLHAGPLRRSPSGAGWHNDRIGRPIGGSTLLMTAVPARELPESQQRPPLPADELNRQVQRVLNHAIIAHRDEIKVYESLRNLNEVVGTEYGDRVLYELIQNAHDAHRAEDRGRIAVRLTVRSATDGTLYVANGGAGFRWKDVDAIMNLATTAKEIGESIGNKGWASEASRR